MIRGQGGEAGFSNWKQWLACSVVCVIFTFAAAPDNTFAAAAADHGKTASDAEHPKAPGPITKEKEEVDLAIWTLVTFVVFLVVLKLLAWKPIMQGLGNREARIQNDIADARKAKIDAEKLLAAHSAKMEKVQEEIREIVAEARRDAEHTKREILAESQREAEANKQRAIVEIGRARDAAMKELFDAAAAQVASATEYVLGRSVTDADQTRLIGEALGKFSQN